jgi:hypothetical protein
MLAHFGFFGVVLLASQVSARSQCVVTSELRDAAGVFECGSEVVFNGYAYQTVQIGDQCWFAENVRTDALPRAEAVERTRVNLVPSEA